MTQNRIGSLGVALIEAEDFRCDGPFREQFGLAVELGLDKVNDQASCLGSPGELRPGNKPVQFRADLVGSAEGLFSSENAFRHC